MANVKVPALLHKMSVSSQKAWYKKNNMELPAHLTGGEGKSAAQAKKDVGDINKAKAARAAVIAKAAASKKNKELVASSDRVRQAASNVQAFGGSRLGGDLSSAAGMIRHIRSGGTLKVAEEADYSKLPPSEAARRRMDDKIKQAHKDRVERAEKAIERYKKGQVPANDIKEDAEQVDEAGSGWMLKADPKLGAKVKTNTDKAKQMNALMKKYGGKTGEEISKMKEEVEGIEENLDVLKNIADTGKAGTVKFKDGSMSKVQPQVAGVIHQLHGALNDENKKKVERMISHSAGQFDKVADFAVSKSQWTINK